MIRSDTRHLDRRRRHQGWASCEVTGRRFEVQGSAPIYMLATRLWVHGHGGADYEVYDDRCVGRMSRMNEKVDWNSMAAQRGHTKSGGRQKGTPNRVTAEIKAAFRKHGDELVDALMALTKSADERVRLGAIQAAVARPGLGQGRAGRGPRRGGGDHQDRAQDRGSDEARVLTLPSARSARASGAVLRQSMAGPCAGFMGPAAEGRRASATACINRGSIRTRPWKSAVSSGSFSGNPGWRSPPFQVRETHERGDASRSSEI